MSKHALFANRPDTTPATPSTLGALAKRLVADPEHWRSQIRFNATERHYARISRTETYEAWLLTWLPGQSTGIHDHGGSSGAFAVIHGALSETTVATGAFGRVSSTTRAFSAGHVHSFGPDHVHDIAAVDVPAVSLHVYGPALATMTRYRIANDRLVLLSRERAGADW